MKLHGLALVACTLLGACHCNDTAPPPPATVDESGGLRASVPKVVRLAPTSRVEVSYLLEWTAAPTIVVAADGTARGSNLWLLQPSEPVYVRFRDAGGQLVGETTDRIDLPPPFLDRSVARHEARLMLDVPAGSATVSVALGVSGLETRPTVVP